MKLFLKLFFVLIFLFSQIYAQKDITGNWDGKIKMLSMDLNFQIKVEKSDSTFYAFLTIPSQKLKDYQLPVFSFKKNKVYFELPGQVGVAKFDGELKADSIKGGLLQAGIKGTFFLARAIEQKLGPQTEQKVEEPLTYMEEEVAFKSGQILLSGTLTLPKEEGKYPAVILLTGSGPQNRDEEILGFKIFQKIADYLTRLNIAVLRYDDRGVGGSTGNIMQSTTEDFSNDAIAAVEFLKKQKNIDHKKIGFIGHSEGGIIAPLAAANSNDIAFVILISGTGVDGGEVLLEQQKLILKAGGAADSLIEQNLNLQKKINEMLKNNKDLNEIRNDIKIFAEKDFANLNAEVKASIQDKEAYINATVQSQINLFDNPWFRFFIRYDPSSALERMKVPVLMTFGGLDLQVSVEQNKPKMEEALMRGGNKNFKSVVFPKANHLYQEAKSGS
ncbi:MAG: alpha/beta fold hydrolase, partial [Bacteroidota bacterium]